MHGLTAPLSVGAVTTLPYTCTTSSVRKVCPQCNTVVHVKRSVCDCGHAFTSKKKKARCSNVEEPENEMKRRKALLSEEKILVRKERDKVCKASKRASERHEQTLHRQELNQTCTYGKHESFWNIWTDYTHHILFCKYHTYLCNFITYHQSSNPIMISTNIYHLACIESYAPQCCSFISAMYLQLIHVSK